MFHAVPNHATHMAMYRIVFTEGPDEESVLCFGTRDECVRCLESLPAVSYSGDRRPVRATGELHDLVPFCSMCSQRHDGACNGASNPPDLTTGEAADGDVP